MTIRSRANRLAVSMGAVILLFLAVAWGQAVLGRHRSLPLTIALQPAQTLADGYEIATLVVERPAAEPAQGPVNISVVENVHGATVQEVAETETGWRAQIRAGVVPGRVLLRVEAPGFLPAVTALTSSLETDDRAGDGTPDFLRLEDEHDQQAFRRWFTFLAEAQYFQQTRSRTAEINDCAALIRYAYREALRLHDSRWAAEAPLPLVPGLESIAKYQYPHTPLGAALFRVRPGSFRPADLADGAFTQFADAQTLRRFNTHFVSQDLSRALPGDLLFFRRLTEHMPFHTMIFLGRSQITTGAAGYVLYHTGPDGGSPGEIRRLRLDELLGHPDPQWRPIERNPIFLGVYRWNILRKAS
jgi:uncharacterized protein YfaT (DUF1175 family)